MSGGETAEMPSLYDVGKYDIAGYCMGILEEGSELPRFERYEEGDLLIALPASGLHCSGFGEILPLLSATGLALSRKSEFGDSSKTLGQQLAKPTLVYVDEVLKMLREGCVKSIAHITSSLLADVKRILPDAFEITLDFGDLKIPAIFGWLAARLHLSANSILHNLNCGIGLVLVVPKGNTSWKVLLKGAKVLGVLKRRLPHAGQKHQIEVKNFDDALEQCATPFGSLGKDQLHTISCHHNLQAALITNAQQRPESYLNQVGKRLIRLPEGYRDPVLIMGTDGVGTKIKIAQATGLNSTVGIDLVAMCANDILCNGAEPLTFSSYYACGELIEDRAKSIIGGVIEGALQAASSLMEAQIAEEPLVYKPNTYDLAGFAMGIAEHERILPRFRDIQHGDVLIGLPSSGVHSNGFSLVHAVMKFAGVGFSDPAPFSSKTFGEEFLTPTRIYVQILKPLLERGLLKALAHITGGGLTENIPRVLTKSLAAHLDARTFVIPPVFGWLAAEGNVSAVEMQRTYNCGLGMVLVVDPRHVNEVLAMLQYSERAAKVGKLIQRKIDHTSQVIVDHFESSLDRVKQMLVKPRKRVAVLISGSGTNLQALIDASRDSSQGLNSDVVLVISNKADVLGVERAKRAGIPVEVISHKDFKVRSEFDAEMSKHLEQARVDVVCLAGFMRVLSEDFVRKWRGKLINIHPSLLPKHPGLHVQQKALDAGDSESGCTVHFVDEGVDTGAIILQASVPIVQGDTVESLTKRIQRAEHFVFPRALRLVATEAVYLSDNGSVVSV